MSPVPRQRLQRGLSALFPAITVDRFLNHYWTGRPLWSHGPVTRFGGLAELDGIGTILRVAVRSRIEMKAILRGTHHHSNEIPIDPSSAISLYDSGATIVCNGLHRWHQVVSAWTHSLTRQLRTPQDAGNCNAYMSPPGVGVGMHFDDHAVIVVQLGGRKRWRFAVNRTVTNPTANSGPDLADEVARYATRPAPRRMPPSTSVELGPGSALFLPRGYWHETDARQASISLTFGFRVPTWVELVRDHLSQRLVEDVRWRESIWDAWASGRRRMARDHWLGLRENLMARLTSTTLDDLMDDEAAEPLVRVRSSSARRATVRAKRTTSRRRGN